MLLEYLFDDHHDYFQINQTEIKTYKSNSDFGATPHYACYPKNYLLYLFD
jgi:hypothetical protein